MNTNPPPDDLDPLIETAITLIRARYAAVIPPVMPQHTLPHAALFVLALGAAATWSAPAKASDPAAQAVSFHQQGNVEFEKKNWAAAEAAYLKAWAITRTFDVAANLGEVEFHLGKMRETAEYLSYSLRTAPPSSKPAQRERSMHFLEQVKEKLGILRLRVNVEGASVSIDGRPIPVEDVANEVFVDPGTHAVTAKRAGYVEASATVEARAGAASEVALSLKPVVQEKPLEKSRSAVPVIALGVASAVGLGLGVGLFVAGNGKYSTAIDLRKSIVAGKGNCVAGAANFDARCAELADISASANTLRDVGVGLLIGGGAAAAGAATYLLWPSSKPATGVNVLVLPVAATTGGGLFATGTF